MNWYIYRRVLNSRNRAGLETHLMAYTDFKKNLPISKKVKFTKWRKKERKDFCVQAFGLTSEINRFQTGKMKKFCSISWWHTSARLRKEIGLIVSMICVVPWLSVFSLDFTSYWRYYKSFMETNIVEGFFVIGSFDINFYIINLVNKINVADHCFSLFL